MKKFLIALFALVLLTPSSIYAANGIATQEEIGLVEDASQKTFTDNSFVITAEKAYQLGTDRVVLFTVAGVDSDGPIIYIVCTEQSGTDPVVLTQCSYVQNVS